jgi:hypothetical protein
VAGVNQDSIDQFEESIKRVKAQYDLFFMGLRKLPPMEDRRRLDTLMHELAKLQVRDNGWRFRFNTLLSKYNQYKELWSRLMREREEGPRDFRKRAAALQAPPEPPAPPPPPTRPVTSEGPGTYVKVGTEADNDAMQQLHQQIASANRQLGKNGSISLEQVAQMVSQQAEAIRSRYRVTTVAFRVETADGKVKLKAKPLQEP